jgi:WD40 repeat protein
VVVFALKSTDDYFPPELVNERVSLESVSSDGAYGVASGSMTKAGMVIWDLQKKKVAKTLEGAADAWLSPDHQKVAYSVHGQKPGLGVLDLTTDAKQIIPISQGTSMGIKCFSPDGTKLAVAAETWAKGKHEVGKAQVFEISTGKMLWELKGHRDEITGLEFSRDGKVLLTRSGSFGVSIDKDGKEIPPDNSIHLWSLADGKELKVLPGGSRYVSEQFTPDDKQLVTLTRDGLIVIYENGTFNETVRTRLPVEGNTTGAAVSPDGHWLLVTYQTSDARLFSLSTLKRAGQLTVTYNDGQRMPLFLPDGRPAVWTCATQMKLLVGEAPR